MLETSTIVISVVCPSKYIIQPSDMLVTDAHRMQLPPSRRIKVLNRYIMLEVLLLISLQYYNIVSSIKDTASYWWGEVTYANTLLLIVFCLFQLYFDILVVSFYYIWLFVGFILVSLSIGL